jgi:heterodisulfide reductase subunit A
MRNNIDHFSNNGKSVLVIGGGVGGIRAALDLAESKRNVTLIDTSYTIGGLMTQLDRTFPTNNCDLCTVSGHLSENARQAFLSIRPMTQLLSLEGESGNFKATLETAPRFIDTYKCTACGECHKQFPDAVKFTPGLDARAPTCMRYPQATPFAFSIDMDKIEDAHSLEKVCKAGAIVVDDKPETYTLDVCSVILSVGASLFDPSRLDNFGAGQFDNVVTGLEYERIMSASGPFQGNLVRKSDGRQPKRVAWIQCVGSRGINREDVPYCSGVCCMVALKEAMVTKERFAEDIETTIFYMDMRTVGKDYESYLNRAKNEYGIRMIRCRPHSIVENADTKDLSITYVTDDSSEKTAEAFDMVVLSTGFRVAQTTRDLAQRLGIELNPHSFAGIDPLNSVKTSRPGVYVCGVAESPKDIPETMVQASAAAGMAGKALPSFADDPSVETTLPPETDVSGQPLRIGVFICDCGMEIGGLIDVKKITRFAAEQPDVVLAQAVGWGCSNESMASIKKAIQDNRINRVVIGGCSPRTHENKFQDLIRKAGLNKYLMEMVNLRDQNTWAHLKAGKEALEKAFQLIRSGIAGVKKSYPLKDQVMPMNQNALIIGGGITGMTAALQLADQGKKVYLIERNRTLGGLAASINQTIEGKDVKSFVQQLIDTVNKHKLIQVMCQTIVVDHTGIPGRFKTGIQTGLKMNYMQISHGVTIFATGAVAARPNQYHLEDHDQIMTQLELDEQIETDPDAFKSMNHLVMIQCVGSREPDNPNCSRVCCQAAIKNALRIKKLNPDISIFILYRDIRTYGFYEDYYRKARDLGIAFIRFTPDKKPQINLENNQTTVLTYDSILGQHIEIEADAIALSTGFMADEETTEDLGMMFHLPRTSDHYFLEDHVKLRPLDTSIPGIYIAGTAHSPQTVRESMTQARAAASRALTLLAKNEINLGAAVARVDSTRCAACLVCVRACPFNIPIINEEGVSQIDPAKCQGCGVCAADCPAKAISLMAYEDDRILAKLNGLFGELN